MKEQKMIHGVVFDVKHVTPNELHQMAQRIISNVKTLDECYQRPSIIKRAIYNTWFDWFESLVDMYSFGIDTYNTNVFTLSGVLEYSFGMVEVIHITPTKHILYTV